MNRITSTCLALGIAAGGTLLAVPPAGAQQAGRVLRQDFHGRDFHRFAPRESSRWRAGRWVQDWHDGRYAWWWIVDGYWYFYPEPMYPFPTYIPPAIVMQRPPPTPSGLPPARVWYYCNDPRGYYPYVASCNGVWSEVPSAPGMEPH